jgi:hypothetical protein
VELPHVHVRERETGVRQRIVGAQLANLLEARDGLVEPATLVLDHAEELPRVDVALVALEQLAARGLGRGEISPLKEPEGFLERRAVLRVRHRHSTPCRGRWSSGPE